MHIPIRPSDYDDIAPLRAGGLEIVVEDAVVGNVDLQVADDEEPGKGDVFDLGDEEECAPRRTAPDPGAPTAEEREDHCVDHLPYRCWCEACVMGRGAGEQHRRGPECRLPVISFDYLLVTRNGIYVKGEVDESNVLLKILAVKDSTSKWVGAHVVSCKGVGGDRYAVERIRADVAWLGYT